MEAPRTRAITILVSTGGSYASIDHHQHHGCVTQTQPSREIQGPANEPGIPDGEVEVGADQP
jgi:hypothetical protein